MLADAGIVSGAVGRRWAILVGQLQSTSLPSVTENAELDIFPPAIPTSAYLGVAKRAAATSPEGTPTSWGFSRRLSLGRA